MSVIDLVGQAPPPNPIFPIPNIPDLSLFFLALLYGSPVIIFLAITIAFMRSKSPNPRITAETKVWDARADRSINIFGRVRRKLTRKPRRKSAYEFYYG